ncbi:MAG: hypothetical protein L6R38_008841 [Xanthoria sp. 2 TBL-2021]|nr:MAG: hypothetical protein L6R38_008841 [Xanthoria sp. 2 TBL-2021]
MTDSKLRNGFVRSMRKVYNPLGFQKGYNFTLWFIFGGALFGFILARLQYLSIGGKFKDGSSPGEWYHLRGGHERIGITLHLATIIPTGFLVVFQFIPWIRYNALLFHRINGYVIVLLLILSNVGALMIARHSFGGEFETQVFVGLLAIMTTVGAVLAYVNIKRLQIDQHRAWMLRIWFWAGSIITLRIIMIISALIIPKVGGFYQAMPCDKISFMFEDDQAGFRESFPACVTPNGTTNGWVAVNAKFSGSSANVAASLGLCFGTAGWLALAIHAAGVETYLRLTPREGNRLRNVSYQRQMEAGFRHPGSSGLTSDRWGDADTWQPASQTTDNVKDEKVASPKETSG